MPPFWPSLTGGVVVLALIFAGSCTKSAPAVANAPTGANVSRTNQQTATRSGVYPVWRTYSHSGIAFEYSDDWRVSVGAPKDEKATKRTVVAASPGGAQIRVVEFRPARPLSLEQALARAKSLPRPPGGSTSITSAATQRTLLGKEHQGLRIRREAQVMGETVATNSDSFIIQSPSRTVVIEVRTFDSSSKKPALMELRGAKIEPKADLDIAVDKFFTTFKLLEQ